jgi:hypothetical protein
MKLYIGVTDNHWFQFLSQLQPDEINFWQPGGKQTFAALSPGEPFLFKLHSPLNFIVGGGFFVRHSFLPVSLAWDAFGDKNGMADYYSFTQDIKWKGNHGRCESKSIWASKASVTLPLEQLLDNTSKGESKREVCTDINTYID